MSTSNFIAELCDRRGSVFGGIEERQTRSTPDQVALDFGLLPLGANWIEVSRDTAFQIFRQLLMNDMAHGCACLDLNEATIYTENFFATFPEGTVYYTNSTWKKTKRSNIPDAILLDQWTPATHATFDSGIIAISEKTVGVLWVEDED